MMTKNWPDIFVTLVVFEDENFHEFHKLIAICDLKCLKHNKNINLDD